MITIRNYCMPREDKVLNMLQAIKSVEKSTEEPKKYENDIEKSAD